MPNLGLAMPDYFLLVLP